MNLKYAPVGRFIINNIINNLDINGGKVAVYCNNVDVDFG